MARRRTSRQPVRFQQFVNPITGLNQRGFCAGEYIDKVAQQLVRDALEKVLVPAGFTLDELEYVFQPRDPPDPIVRLVITPPSLPQEQHEVRVKDEGVTQWAGPTAPILVAWVKDQYGL